MCLTAVDQGSVAIKNDGFIATINNELRPKFRRNFARRSRMMKNTVSHDNLDRNEAREIGVQLDGHSITLRKWLLDHVANDEQ